MAYSHVAHDCHIGNSVTFANGVPLGGHVEVGDGVNLGGLCAMQQFGRIGRGAFVGGVTGVPDDVIPYGMVVGDRARLLGLNLVGLKRKGIPRERIHALRAAYKSIFFDEDGHVAERAEAAGERWKDCRSARDRRFHSGGCQAADLYRRGAGMTQKLKMTERGTLGIIACGGELPIAIAESAREAGRTSFFLL